jgi:cytochrome b subunit of formate dehydrogenase
MSHRKHANRPQPIPVPETSEVPDKEEKKKSPLDLFRRLFKWIHPLDFVIMIVGGIVISKVDFSNVTLIDVIYMTSYLMWFLFLLVRIYFIRLNRNFDGKDN